MTIKWHHEYHAWVQTLGVVVSLCLAGAATWLSAIQYNRASQAQLESEMRIFWADYQQRKDRWVEEFGYQSIPDLQKDLSGRDFLRAERGFKRLFADLGTIFDMSSDERWRSRVNVEFHDYLGWICHDHHIRKSNSLPGEPSKGFKSKVASVVKLACLQQEIDDA